MLLGQLGPLKLQKRAEIYLKLHLYYPCFFYLEIYKNMLVISTIIYFLPKKGLFLWLSLKQATLDCDTACLIINTGVKF